MQDADPKPNRLHAEMPHIPGVAGSAAPSHATSPKTIQGVVLAVVLLLVGGIAWWVVRTSQTKAAPVPVTGEDAADQATPSPRQPSPAANDASANPSAAATVEQLAAPWSSRKFTFVDPATREPVPAMVIHIPGAAASHSEAYWAFSLNTPYQNCALDYVTNVAQIASKYGYRAAHPMIVSACDGSVYDPLQVASVSSGAWVRGQVVQGSAIRPPLAINIRIAGRSLIADKIE